MKAHTTDNMKEYTTVKAQVEYGLDAIEDHRTVEVSLRDLMYVHQTIGEFVRFFHQLNHYPTLEHVKLFLSFPDEPDESAFELLCECYYRKLADIWPEDVKAMIVDDEKFTNPVKPYYYAPIVEP